MDADGPDADGPDDVRVEINVVLDDDGRAHADETLAALESAGVEVVRYRQVLGVVTGRVRGVSVTTLTAIRGVRAVEPNRTVGPV